MLIVAGSGLIRRFLYSRVHRGYSGRKLEVRALLTEMHEFEASVDQLGSLGTKVKAYLTPYEKAAVTAGSSFWSSASAVVQLGISTRRSQRQIRREVTTALQSTGIEIESMTRRLAALRKPSGTGSAAEFPSLGGTRGP